MILAVKCWLCGQPVDLGQINVMSGYERYLMLTFVLSLMMRVHQYKTNLMFAWQFPQRWPSVFEVVKQHKHVFLTWTMLLPVGITLAVLLAHSLCYRLIWSDADVTPSQLGSYWWVVTLLLAVGSVMLVLDMIALFSATQTNFDEIEKNLGRGEFALTSRTMWALKISTFGFVNPRKVVESRVAESLHAVRLVLLAQLRRWSFHTAVRITFGFLLWFSFGWLTNRISQSTFWIYVFLLAVWLGIVYWWTRQPTLPTETAEPAE